MSSVDCLREFVNKRLTAAAEEIFSVFIKTIVEYEEEIDRQRKLLDVASKPEARLNEIDLPRQHVCKEEVFADHLLFNQETNSSLDQESDLPQIKEEQEEVCTSPEGEQLVVKLETDDFMLTPADEETDHSEAELESDQLFLSNDSHIPESQDQRGSKHGDAGPTRDSESKKRQNKSESHSVNSMHMSDSEHNSLANKKSFKCDICGKDCKFQSQFNIHLRSHTGEKPYFCKTCGKRFGYQSTLKNHEKFHRGEKPHVCKMCGKRFSLMFDLKRHTSIHTGERPYSCKICAKDFRFRSDLKVHMRIHTGEKPYTCETCGKGFSRSNYLKDHMYTHC